MATSFDQDARQIAYRQSVVSTDSGASELCRSRLTSTQSTRRPRGRPPKARQVWQRPNIQRSLVRLYLYTAESTLSTGKMVDLLAGLTQSDGAIPGQRDSKPVVHIRSMQYELKSLLSRGYHGLRPRSREEARRRVEGLRSVRAGRIGKSRLTSRPQTRQNDAEAVSVVENNSEMDQSRTLSAGRHSIETPRSSIDTTSLQQLDHKSVRLSWVRERLTRSSSDRPPSSVILEIRSLLSAQSIRSSLFSQRAGTTSHTAKVWRVPALPRDQLGKTEGLVSNPPIKNVDADHVHNNRLIRLCCKHHYVCLHQRMSGICQHVVEQADLSPSVYFQEITDDELSIRHGRDIWNQTILHLFVRWAPHNPHFLSMLIYLISRADPRLLNVRNLDGDTFMHLLAYRISRPEARLYWWSSPSIVVLVSLAHSRGYKAQLRNSAGLNFLACLLPSSSPGDNLESGYYPGIVVVLNAIAPPGSKESFPIDDFLSLSLSTRTPEGGLVAKRVSDFLSNQEQILRLHQKVLPYSYSNYYTLTKSTLQKYSCWSSNSSTYEPADWRIIGPATSPRSIQAALERGEDPNSYNELHQTMLMSIMEKMRAKVLGEEEGELIIEILLDYGADVRLRDPDGNTALHYAVRAQLPIVVNSLINAGIDIMSKNVRDVSAADLAAKQYEMARPGVAGAGPAYGKSQSVLVRLFDIGFRRTNRVISSEV